MKKKLFVLEDDEISRYIMKAILQQFKMFSTSYFADSVTLIDYMIRHTDVQAHLPDVIFVDLNMTGLNGWDVLDAIRHITPLIQKDIAVYVVTTSVSPIDRKRALAYPFVKDFVSKPINTLLVRQIITYLYNTPHHLNS